MINPIPVKVQVKYNHNDTPVDGLMYDIHYNEQGEPLATCYLTKSKCWFTCLLGFVEPVFEKNKKSLNEQLSINKEST